jgi:hypothetical protein
MVKLTPTNEIKSCQFGTIGLIDCLNLTKSEGTGKSILFLCALCASAVKKASKF